jgi:hypothetical protein
MTMQASSGPLQDIIQSRLSAFALLKPRRFIGIFPCFVLTLMSAVWFRAAFSLINTIISSGRHDALFPAIVALIPAVAFGIPAIHRIYIIIVRYKSIRMLKEHGRKTQARIECITSTKKRGAYKVTAIGRDKDGAIKEFISDEIIGAPQLKKVSYQHKKINIDVYTDRSEADIFYVDVLGFLKKSYVQQNDSAFFTKEDTATSVEDNVELSCSETMEIEEEDRILARDSIHSLSQHAVGLGQELLFFLAGVMVLPIAIFVSFDSIIYNPDNPMLITMKPNRIPGLIILFILAITFITVFFLRLKKRYKDSKKQKRLLEKGIKTKGKLIGVAYALVGGSYLLSVVVADGDETRTLTSTPVSGLFDIYRFDYLSMNIFVDVYFEPSEDVCYVDTSSATLEE